MNRNKSELKILTLCFGLFGVVISSQPSKAQSFDMDCKVILCIAGGFPAACGDAYAYMISRITRWPAPLPPFGFCAMSNGSGYDAHDVDYSFLNQEPESFECTPGKTLQYRREEDESGNVTETGFCYSHITNEYIDGSNYRTVFHNQSPAQRINFQLKITIEPGTKHEFRSPLFRINTSTGYVSQQAS